MLIISLLLRLYQNTFQVIIEHKLLRARIILCILLRWMETFIISGIMIMRGKYEKIQLINKNFLLFTVAFIAAIIIARPHVKAFAQRLRVSVLDLSMEIFLRRVMEVFLSPLISYNLHDVP